MIHLNGRAIRRLREARGLSQKRLAYLADMTQSALCRLELGRSAAREANVIRIAEALGVGVAEITGQDEEATPGEGFTVGATRGTDPIAPQMPGTWYGGLTMREWLAGLALQGIAATHCLSSNDPDADRIIGEIAELAVRHADATIRVLNGGRGDLSATAKGEAAGNAEPVPTMDPFTAPDPPPLPAGVEAEDTFDLTL